MNRLSWALRALADGDPDVPVWAPEDMAGEAYVSEDPAAFLEAVANDPLRRLEERSTAVAILNYYVAQRRLRYGDERSLGDPMRGEFHDSGQVSGHPDRYWWEVQCPECGEGESLVDPDRPDDPIRCTVCGFDDFPTVEYPPKRDVPSHTHDYAVEEKEIAGGDFVERWKVCECGERECVEVLPRRDAGIYSSYSEIVEAIRLVDRHADKVRLNEGGRMDVVDPEPLERDEGFVAVYEQGSVRYVVEPYGGPSGEFDSPWIRRSSDGSSVGRVDKLAVEWDINR